MTWDDCMREKKLKVRKKYSLNLQQSIHKMFMWTNLVNYNVSNIKHRL